MQEIEMASRKPTEIPLDEQQSTTKRPEKILAASVPPLITQIETKVLNVKAIDTSANSVPIGSITFAMNIILYGFYLVDFYKFNPILLTELLFVGGIGGITAGSLEFFKGRSSFLVSFFYCYGFWSLNVFTIAFFNLDNWIGTKEDSDSLVAFTFFWLIVSGMIFIGSFRSNVVFVICSGAMFVMFLLSVVYHGVEKLGVRKASGVFGIIGGVCGLYIGMGQILAQEFNREIFPMWKLSENGFDVWNNKEKRQEE